MSNEALPRSELILYQTEDGRTRIQCRFENDTLWLSQALIAELFQVTAPTVNEHLKGIFSDGELAPEATIRKFRIVRMEGARQVTRNLLEHAGKVSAAEAKNKAELEYEQYRAFLDTQPRRVDADFEKAVKDLKRLPHAKKARLPKP